MYLRRKVVSLNYQWAQQLSIFAYAVHSDVGNHCVAAVVEHKPYPLSQALESGQTVEIVTSENTHPSVSWLNFVVTARARTRIRHF